jgi:peptide-methionine (S)-S-oxide reductase
MGGRIARPTYKEVCSGLTGHVEVVQITFDPAIVPYERLLEVFWKTHDPTTPNRQGADEGTQYRSVVFYHSIEQKLTAEKIKEAFNASKVFDAPVITGVEPASEFYKAEDYHQNYFRENGEQPYCRAVVRPKVEKFEKLFRDLVR